MKKGLSLLFSLGCCAWGNSLLSNSANAQVIEDGTTNTTINSNGNNFTIENGDRAGGNLFHSFQDFSVPNEGSAVFNNAADIENIFSRVTGGNVSNINGLIQANDANLFLINPAGIMFGVNGRLDIGGSFLGTTADSILFDDGEFSATDFDSPPLLTVNAPIGLNFRDRPQQINIDSTSSADFNPEPSFDDNLFGLRVTDGKTFALAGGDIEADGGGIVAVGGRIELGAVGEAGTIGLGFSDDNIRFDFPENLVRSNVSLTNNAGFLIAGNNDGDIRIIANQLNFANGSGLFAGIFPGLGSLDAQAGDIVLDATDSISLSQNSNVNNNVGNSNFTAAGNSGDILINTQDLIVEDGSAISVSTFGEGNAGDLIINAANSVSVSGETEFPGGLFAQVDRSGKGLGGNLNIDTSRLSVSNGSKIQVATFGQGNAGRLKIKAVEIEIFNTSIFSDFTTGIFGTVAIDPRTVNLPEGEGGNIEITTEQLRVIDGGKISVGSEGIGSAGNLSINATESIEVRGIDPEPEDGTSLISAEVGGEAIGEGGNISLQTEQLSISDQGEISASSQSGEGGNISLQIDNEIVLQNNSLISAEAFNTANGGNLTIDTNFIVAFPEGNNDIVANAEQGEGGVININAESLLGIQERPLNDSTNDINASSEDSRLDGNITINTSDINPIQGTTELPSNLVVPEQNVAQACAASQNTTQANRLVVRGKGGVPTLPTATLSSEIITINGKPIDNSNYAISTNQGNVIPARGIVKKANGNVVLTSNPIADRVTRFPNSFINCT